jgi:hypothetical protein
MLVILLYWMKCMSQRISGEQLLLTNQSRMSLNCLKKIHDDRGVQTPCASSFPWIERMPLRLQRLPLLKVIHT